MNRSAWIGIIVWGMFLTAFGLATAPGATASVAAQAQDAIFLIAGGLVSILIGTIGLLGLMGWVPGPTLFNEQKKNAECTAPYGEGGSKTAY